MKSNGKCDEKCFECKYPDCILSEEDIKLPPIKSKHTEKQKAYFREYARTHYDKEKQKERHRDYYLRHREERIEYAKEYQKRKKMQQ